MNPIITAAASIDGWMKEVELEWLAEQGAKHVRMAEVGCWKGRSTKALSALTRGSLTAIDKWNGCLDNADGTYDEGERNGWESIYQQFCNNLCDEIKDGRVVIRRMDSISAAKTFSEGSLDFVFIDGDHRYEAIRAEIEAYRPLVGEGGIFSGHDYEPPTPDVMRAVDELIPERLIVPGGSIWYVKVGR